MDPFTEPTAVAASGSATSTSDSKEEKKDDEKSTKKKRDDMEDDMTDDDDGTGVTGATDGAPVERKEEEATNCFLAERCAGMALSSRLSDVNFVVGKDDKKKTLYAHRFILAVASPVLEAMVYPQQAFDDNSTAKLPLVITLPEEKPESFSLMLQCIYSDKVELTSETVRDLLRMACKYEVEKLANFCTEFITNELTVDTAFDMLELTTSLHCDAANVMTFISENAEALVESDAFKKLTRSTIKVFLADDSLGVDEPNLLQGVIDWAKAESKRNSKKEEDWQKEIADLVPLVRFPLFTMQEIATVVSATGLVPQGVLVDLFAYQSTTDEAEKKKIAERIPYATTIREGGFMTKESNIVSRKYKKEIMRLFDNKKVKFELLWRGSRDGFDGSTFHAKCDGKGPTITFIKAGQYISGGYHGQSWSQSGSYSSSDCWIFTLENPSHTPMKMIPNGSSSQAYNGSGYGPTWGGGHDLHVSGSSMRSSSSNYSSPSSFTGIASGYSGSFTNSTLFGSYYFTVEEIETLKVVTPK